MSCGRRLPGRLGEMQPMRLYRRDDLVRPLAEIRPRIETLLANPFPVHRVHVANHDRPQLKAADMNG
jgi:hypothetical protein